MGCCSSDGGGEPIIPVDPLERALKQIKDDRETLNQLLVQVADAENENRYLDVTIHKQSRVLCEMKPDFDEAETRYDNLKQHIANRDAYELRKASKGFGTDESRMASVIVGRLRENIVLSDTVYQNDYGRTLEDQVRGENKTMVGLITGGLSRFGRFLVYRCMPHAERDAFLIHKCMSGIGCSDYILCEILSTRSNAQLRDAAECYANAHDGESMVERIMKETGGFGKKWYGKWIDMLVEFDRDESTDIQGDPIELAQQLYDAGAAKFMGCDEQVFIDVLNKANEATCIAIAQAYEELECTSNSLKRDIEKKMGGDLEFAVIARLLPKSQFLSFRLFKACKGFGTDEECIGRVLACLEKHEAQELEEYYNEFFQDEDEPFNNLRNLLSSELSGSFLDCLIELLDSVPPKGHSRPDSFYPGDALVAGHDFRAITESAYGNEYAIADSLREMNGPLELCHINSNTIFLRDGYVFDIQAPRGPWPGHENTYEELFGDDPTDLEAAKSLLQDLRLATSDVEGSRTRLIGFNGSLFETYLNQNEELRRVETHLRQFEDDVVNMLEHSASKDADLLYEAVKGIGTDEDGLIRVLCSQSKLMLRRIDEFYVERYEKTLADVIDGELGFFDGHFKTLMKYVLMSEAELDAKMLKDSMEGFGTNDTLLSELVCTRSNKELAAACEAFREENGKGVFDWIDGDTSGGYGQFLLACMRGVRDEGISPDVGLASKQAEELRAGGLGEGDIDTDCMIRILADSSVCQVRAIAAAYEEKYGQSLTAVIEEIGGDWGKALKARVMDKPTYYATVVEAAVKGWGTDDTSLCRVFGRNSLFVIKQIAAQYQKLYGRSLHDAIVSDTSGNFQKAILTMVFAEGPGADVDPGAEEEGEGGDDGETEASVENKKKRGVKKPKKSAKRGSQVSMDEE
eukprot:TRINITY_DN40537_c0_g1_i1.p1 TRINITY_DN40537_c0_g1~~TRINITY_DN40537_c0_g1_i1.p1  ORF type:complete len:916 (+),score=136.35 TRINITY_DN40537_c0_g1_i1:181-2928(+)